MLSRETHDRVGTLVSMLDDAKRERLSAAARDAGIDLHTLVAGVEACAKALPQLLLEAPKGGKPVAATLTRAELAEVTVGLRGQIAAAPPGPARDDVERLYCRLVWLLATVG